MVGAVVICGAVVTDGETAGGSCVEIVNEGGEKLGLGPVEAEGPDLGLMVELVPGTVQADDVLAFGGTPPVPMGHGVDTRAVDCGLRIGS